MKTDTEWFRRTTWSDEDRLAFLQRNSRSRGDFKKGQYVRIQAVTLFTTGTANLIRAALELLRDHYFPAYSSQIDSASAYCTAAECCEALGLRDEAIAYYRSALAREREFPGSKSNASFLFAKLAVELYRQDLLGEALSAIDAFGSSMFPWHAYIASGARAVFFDAQGDRDTARSLARAALDAAAVRDTGLSHGRGGLGTVLSTATPFHAIVVGLVGA